MSGLVEVLRVVAGVPGVLGGPGGGGLAWPSALDWIANILWKQSEQRSAGWREFLEFKCRVYRSADVWHFVFWRLSAKAWVSLVK